MVGSPTGNRGLSWENTVSVRKNTVLVRKNTVLVRKNTVLVRKNTVLVRKSTVFVRKTAFFSMKLSILDSLRGLEGVRTPESSKKVTFLTCFCDSEQKYRDFWKISQILGFGQIWSHPDVGPPYMPRSVRSGKI